MTNDKRGASETSKSRRAKQAMALHLLYWLPENTQCRGVASRAGLSSLLVTCIATHPS